MLRPLLIALILLLSPLAHALDASDEGTYAIVRRGGALSELAFYAQVKEGRWQMEQREPDGRWNPMRCSLDCALRDSGPADIARIFPPQILQQMTPTCVHNGEFAFCSVIAVGKSGPKHYVFVSLVTPQPAPIRLQRLGKGRVPAKGKDATAI